MDDKNVEYQGFVYLWENLITGEKYLGSHIGSINDKYIASGVEFLKNVKQYGIGNFKRIIIEFVNDRSKVREREQYWLDFYNAADSKEFLNKSHKAIGGFDHINKNNDVKEKAKKIISKKAKERLKLKHPRGFLGKKHNEETKEKISKSTSQKLRKKIGKSVYQYSLTVVFLKKWEILSDAARFYKTSPSNILYACNSKFKSCRGYLWRWNFVEKIDVDDITLFRWRGKKVNTPEGIMTVTQAAKRFGFNSTSHVRKLCLDKTKEDWYYLIS